MTPRHWALVTELMIALFTKRGSKQRELFLKGKMNLKKQLRWNYFLAKKKMSMASCCLHVEFVEQNYFLFQSSC